MGKKYLALFDLDGTLFDTSEVNYYAYREALQLFGIELNRDYFFSQCVGRHYMEFLPQLIKGGADMEEIHEAKKNAYRKNLNKARINVHLFKMIKAMMAEYHLAIVTTASKKNVMDILTYFGYGDWFEYMITQEDITRVKPDSQGFEMAMEHFSIVPENTVIFEDSEVGIKAARVTGATVMIVDKF